MTLIERSELNKNIETATGYHCVYDQYSGQSVYYGTNSKFDQFVTMSKDYLSTGDMAIIIDTNVTKIYSAFTKQFV